MGRVGGFHGGVVALGLGCLAAWSHARPIPLATTSSDFFFKGTQPNSGASALHPFTACSYCHADYADPDNSAPFDLVRAPGRWAGSMHAHAARSPNFLAALAIANQSLNHAGEDCFRCHAPGAWLEGRVVGHPDGSGLTSTDYEIGVSCHLCHRLVNPANTSGVPSADAAILTALAGNTPTTAGSAQMVLDPQDRRRGPFNLDQDWQSAGGWPGFHDYLESPFHQTGQFCGTCHDVSNPVMSKQPDGSYAVNGYNQAHPTGNPSDMFPEQRTFSEWLNTSYANGGVNLNGRFGGNKLVVSACQDCHMPDTTGTACDPGYGGPVRTDDPQHQFAGVNVYGLQAVQYVYGAAMSDYYNQAIAKGIADTQSMLQRATDETLTQTGAQLTVRITNYCGHKLFTGYPEGRRGWINVQFYNASNALIAERGAYDAATATLTENDTKVYQARQGMDATMLALTGVKDNPTLYLVLNNMVQLDNRIPPLGFTNAAFAAVQAAPVGATYADGQNWDDTAYLIPNGATSARVRFYHQAVTREYIEFLQDTNSTNDAGDVAYTAWLGTGMGAPDLMDDENISLSSFILGDLNGDGHVNTVDLAALLRSFGRGPGKTPSQGDLNGDGVVNTVDLSLLLAHFGQ